MFRGRNGHCHNAGRRCMSSEISHLVRQPIINTAPNGPKGLKGKGCTFDWHQFGSRRDTGRGLLHETSQTGNQSHRHRFPEGQLSAFNRNQLAEGDTILVGRDSVLFLSGCRVHLGRRHGKVQMAQTQPQPSSICKCTATSKPYTFPSLRNA